MDLRVTLNLKSGSAIFNMVDGPQRWQPTFLPSLGEPATSPLPLWFCALSLTCFAQEKVAEVMLCDFQTSSLGGFAASIFPPFGSQPPYRGQTRLLKDERPWTEKEGDHPEGNPSPSANSQRHGPRHVGEAILDFPAPRKWPQHRKKRQRRPSQPAEAPDIRAQRCWLAEPTWICDPQDLSK